MNAYPSAAEIDRLLSYDPNTGEFGGRLAQMTRHSLRAALVRLRVS